MTKTTAHFLGATLAGLGLVALAFGALRSAREHPMLLASAVVAIERDESDLPSLGDRMPAGTDLDYIVQTETELIPSALILDPVIESLDLNSIFGNLYNDRQKLKTSESREILKNAIQASPIPGEARFRIEVRLGVTEDPVQIANRIAEQYCDYRKTRRKNIAEDAARRFAEPLRQAEEPFIAAKEKMESARTSLPVGLRSNPPQISKDSIPASLQEAGSLLNQATIRSLVLSNQIASLTASGSPDANALERAKVEFMRLTQSLSALEARVNAESKTAEALKEYWLAREKFESAEKSFAPFKRTAEEIAAINAPDKKPGATVLEQAEKTEPYSRRDARSGLPWFIVGAIFLMSGVPIFFSNRAPDKSRA